VGVEMGLGKRINGELGFFYKQKTSFRIQLWFQVVDF